MKFCGIDINCHNLDDILTSRNNPTILVTVNAEAIVRANTDARLKRIIDNNKSSIDGQIPLWLFKMKYPGVLINKISGSDLIYSVSEYASQNGLGVFLLGGKQDSNSGAISRLRKLYPMLNIDGFSPDFHPYPFSNEIENHIRNRLISFRPDILFVGFGMGKQEYWEEDNLELLGELGTRLIIGCGGSFEFASGKIKRAPVFIQNVGLESVWRLFKEFKWFRIKRLLISFKIFYYYYQHIRQ